VTLADNAIPDSQIAMLKQALPECYIFIGY